MKQNAEASRLFDKLYIEVKCKKLTRRKIIETLNRIKTWLNKELCSEEAIPKEFSEILQTQHYNHQPLSQNLSYEVLKMNFLWSKAL